MVKQIMTLKIRSLGDLLVAIKPFWLIVRTLERKNRAELDRSNTIDLSKYTRCRIVHTSNGYFFGYNADWEENERKARLKATIEQATLELEKLEEKKP